jgi:ubiquinone/menaquinone biosynthesis C-methylase UbiE
VIDVGRSEQMIDLSRIKASREGAADRLEFRTADAQHLPFEDDLFDVVICESVTAFLDDRQKVSSMCSRSPASVKWKRKRARGTTVKCY